MDNGNEESENNLFCGSSLDTWDFKLTNETLTDSAKRLFGVGNSFINKHVMKKACDEFGSKWGFQFVSSGRRMNCNREPQKARSVKKTDNSIIETHKKTRNRTSNIKVGCEFHFKYRLLPDGHTLQVWEGCYEHNAEKGCIPSGVNLTVVRKSSGYYTSNLGENAMEHFLSMLSYGKLTAKVVRNLFKHLIPSNVPIDAQFIVNLRLKAARRLPEWQATGCIPKTDYNFMNTYDGLDNDEDLYHDKATVEARRVMEEVLNEDEGSSTMYDFLSKLNGVDPSFQYRLAKDPETNTLIGVIWQNAAMRSMFEDYGNVLFTDVMKRPTNSIRWPYISLTVLDSMKMTHVVAEGIICGEYKSAYSWVLQSLFDMAPKRDKNTISTIFADQFIDDSCLLHMGFLNLPLIAYDYWHLKDSVLPKRFGRYTFLTIKTHLIELINAENVQEFEDTVHTLQNMLAHNQSDIRKLNEFVLERKRYAKFELYHHKGSLQRRGSAPAEGNHASYLKRIGPLLTDSPIIAITAMLERQKEIVKEKNVKLTNYKNETISFRSKGRTLLGQIDEDAFQYLSLWGYTLFKKELEESKHYTAEKVNFNNPEMYRLKRNNVNTNTYRLVGYTSRCTCSIVISFGIMCRHEIALHDTFIATFFEKRWTLVDCVRLSTVTNDEMDHNCRDEEFLDEDINNPNTYSDGMSEVTPIIDLTTENIESIVENSIYETDEESTVVMSASKDSFRTVIGKTKSKQSQLQNEGLDHNDFMNLADNVYNSCQHNKDATVAMFGVMLEIQRAISTGTLSSIVQVIQESLLTSSTTTSISGMNNVPETVISPNRQSQENQDVTTSTTKTSVQFTTVTNNNKPCDPVILKSTHNTKTKRILSPGEFYDNNNSPKKRQKVNTSSIKKKLQFTSCTASECKDVKSVKKAIRHCSFCKGENHINSKSSPCDLVLRYGTPMDKTLDLVKESKKKVFIYSSNNNIDTITNLDPAMTKHLVIHRFVVRDDCTNILLLTTLLGDKGVPLLNGKEVITSIAAVIKWTATTRQKVTVLIDGRWKPTNQLLRRRVHNSQVNDNSHFNLANVGNTDEDEDQYEKFPKDTSKTSRICNETSNRSKAQISSSLNNNTNTNEKPSFNGVTDLSGGYVVTRKNNNNKEKGWQHTKTSQGNFEEAVMENSKGNDESVSKRVSFKEQWCNCCKIINQ